MTARFSQWISLPDTFIIFDTEYTAWEGSQERDWSGANEYRELVQISALRILKINHTIEIVDHFNVYVLPLKNPALSKYFINLTGITQQKLEQQGQSFSMAMAQFYTFCQKDHRKLNLYSMGNDYPVIRENLIFNNIPSQSIWYVWQTKFYDIKPFFSKWVNTDKYTSGTLYKAFGIVPKNVSVHNAHWDCISLFLSLKQVTHKIRHI